MSSARIPATLTHLGWHYRLVERTATAAMYSQHNSEAPASPALGYQVVRVKQTLQELVGRPPIVCRETMYAEDWMSTGLLFAAGQQIRALAALAQIRRDTTNLAAFPV